ncbi:MAG TPA: DUF885 family protein [Methylobacter sp.]|jgi:hypothetical protein
MHDARPDPRLSIGLHTQGMTVETSEKMFRELAFRDEENARQQAARGTFDPAYLNYTLGKLMIRKLRDEWTATRGRSRGMEGFSRCLSVLWRSAHFISSKNYASWR